MYSPLGGWQCNPATFLPVRRHAGAGISCRPVSVCICHTPVLYQNGGMDKADFFAHTFPST